MTSEMVIMNKEAVALAADSAMTMYGGKKIYNSGNKLFALSKFHPVGIMIYGNASFMNIPLETIIKLFREDIFNNKFDKLEQYAEKFIEFLDKNVIGVSEKEQIKYLEGMLGVFLANTLRQEILDNSEAYFKERGSPISSVEIENISKEVIDKYLDNLLNRKKLSCFPEDFLVSFEKEFKIIFKKLLKDIFQEFPLSEEYTKKLKNICELLIEKDIFPDWHTGIVVSGFGEKEIFPSTISYKIEALIKGKLKYKKEKTENIDFDSNASILPFAQFEMVYTFMEGINPNYRTLKREYLKNILEEYPDRVESELINIKKLSLEEIKILKDKLKELSNEWYKDYEENMDIYVGENHINPIMDIVSVLPKDELAAMAEALINLTSFKRRVSMSKETVGGPIDVAVISKGDGFIWIKRKHYFKPELNPRFINNYFNKN